MLGRVLSMRFKEFSQKQSSHVSEDTFREYSFVSCGPTEQIYLILFKLIILFYVLCPALSLLVPGQILLFSEDQCTINCLQVWIHILISAKCDLVRMVNPCSYVLIQVCLENKTLISLCKTYFSVSIQIGKSSLSAKNHQPSRTSRKNKPPVRYRW